MEQPPEKTQLARVSSHASEADTLKEKFGADGAALELFACAPPDPEKFQRDNETSFADDGGVKAVLGVTSGLKLPQTMLPTKSAEDKIAALIRCHYTGNVARRLIDREMERRRGPLLRNKPGGSEPKWWQRLPGEQEEELRRAVEAEIELPRLGLVDAGGRSEHPAGRRMLSDGHRHGFIAAVTAAFAGHYPLALKPQHFWLMVAHGLAAHIDMEAEAVRGSWVENEGEETLTVCCDDFQLDQANDWASVVSGKPDSFAAQVAANSVDGVMEVLDPPFSNTSASEAIAQKVVVMGSCKDYFRYRCSTSCGFPQITLEGTVADWAMLREATERLLGRCEKGFASEWEKSLMSVLDKLLAAREGEVDGLFWNSMCKLGGTFGSGSRTWFNGWFNVFFPYVNRRRNPFCEPYSADRSYVVGVSNEMDEHTGELSPGPDCEDFGSGMSQAPVAWDCRGREVPLEFNAGFIGAVQDAETLEITPQIGWFITYKVPEDAEAS